MKKIQMVDLVSQYEKIKPSIDMAIQDVIQHAHFINGPAVGRFQADLQTYLDVKHVIPCANGTDALQIAMMALGLKPGDEVITPSLQTHFYALMHQRKCPLFLLMPEGLQLPRKPFE